MDATPVIRLVHLTGVVFLLTAPFVACTVLPLMLHVTILLAMVMHWIAGHHFCILSFAETKLRGIPFEAGVLTRIMRPFFRFGQGRPWAYLLALALLSLSICRLVRLSRQN